MLDEAETRQIRIDVAALAAGLGIPVIPTVATKNQGMRELVDAALSQALQQSGEPLRIDYGTQIEVELSVLEELIIAVPGLVQRYNPRYLAIKLLEGDAYVQSIIKKEGSAAAAILAAQNGGMARLQKVYDDNLDSVIVESRYQYIANIVKQAVRKEENLSDNTVSDKIDRVVLNRFLGIPIFLLLMFGMFQFTFTLGAPLTDYLDTFFSWLGSLAAANISSPLLSSLVVDALIGGVGSVLLFVPPIFLLFLFISVLEDSGYMARAAYIIDRFMQSLGLHGKSFIPLIVSFGCNVPAVMATRTLESKSDRMITMLITPLMSCSARLPVYILFAGAFFSTYQGLIIFSLYLLGIVLAITMAYLFKRFLFKGEEAPFIMELPPYRMPDPKATFLHVWDLGKSFLTRAGTIILAGVILVWVLANAPWGVEYASTDSLMGMIGSALAPIFAPLGFGTWQAASALIFGFLAKEAVVGTLGVIYGSGDAGLTATISQLWTPLSAYSFMVMSFLYVPFVAAYPLKRPGGNSRGWTLFAVAYSLILGWVMAFIVYQGGRLLGFN